MPFLWLICSLKTNERSVWTFIAFHCVSFVSWGNQFVVVDRGRHSPLWTQHLNSYREAICTQKLTPVRCGGERSSQALVSWGHEFVLVDSQFIPMSVEHHLDTVLLQHWYVVLKVDLRWSSPNFRLVRLPWTVALITSPLVRLITSREASPDKNWESFTSDQLPFLIY